MDTFTSKAQISLSILNGTCTITAMPSLKQRVNSHAEHVVVL